MTEMPRFSFRDTVLLLAVVAASAGARVWYLTCCLDSPGGPPPLAVQDLPATGILIPEGPSAPKIRDAYSNLVHNLKEHTWGGSLAPLSDREERTAHAAPGYAWLAGRIARLTGDADGVPELLRWGQCGLGAVTAGLYFLFARRAFRSAAAGTLAGLLCAIHPFWVANTAEIADGTLASFLLAAALFLGARAAQEGDALCSLLYGLALAALALTRAALLPFAAVACLWFLLRCRTVQRGWLCALLAFLGFANGLAPWAVRNWMAFRDVVPVADSAYLHLWIGVNSAATGGPQDEATLRTTLPPERLQKLLAEENQAKRYGQLARDVVEKVEDDPARAVRLRFRAAGCFIFGESWLNDGPLARTESPGSLPHELERAAPLILEASLFVLLALALLGWRWTYGWRRESMPLSLALVWIPLPYVLSHAERFSGPRLPLDGVLICYAAFALLCLVPGLGAKLLAGGAGK